MRLCFCQISTLCGFSGLNLFWRLGFAAILYQEYSDVAINREIQRQQGKEPSTEEEGLRDDGSDGTQSPSNLSPSSSFRSSRGSAFALWQDIPDVRTSGQLDHFSKEERKLQEVGKMTALHPGRSLLERCTRFKLHLPALRQSLSW